MFVMNLNWLGIVCNLSKYSSYRVVLLALRFNNIFWLALFENEFKLVVYINWYWSVLQI